MNTMNTQAFTADIEAAPSGLVNAEANFDIKDLFFSRTDSRGVIDSFNEVFSRVAGYSEEEMLGAPHKIVRHPDMPKAVFWLLWNGLEKGVPVGAYVKNKTKEGKYYWVFALASPNDQGYLSVRLKPTSALFGKVKALYSEILRAEQEQGLRPAESAKLLLSRIRELGFPTYAMFQAHAIFEEFEARRVAMKIRPFPDLENSEVISKNAQALRHELVELEAKFANAALLTANMRVFAAKLQVGRDTINEIAKNYDLMLRDIQNHLVTLHIRDEFEDAWDVTKDQNSFFLLCASHLMEEMCTYFEDELRVAGAPDHSEEARHLRRLRQVYRDQALKAVLHGIQSAVTIKRRVEFLRRMILGLSTVRIACRVEAGTLRGKAKGMETIVSRLDIFHDEVELQLVKIQKIVVSILRNVDNTITDSRHAEEMKR